MKKILSIVLFVLIVGILLVSCASNDLAEDTGKYNVVATTTIVGDLVKEIGGDKVNIISLMGPGVDPHLYKASAGDVTKMQSADMVVYSGLHLEGKMADIFENLRGGDKLIVAATEDIEEKVLLASADYEGSFDPHVWFDIGIWKTAAKSVARGLEELDNQNSQEYEDNLTNYLLELDELEKYVKDRISELPEDKRILITAHDAFQYFAKAYDFQVKGLQGISTDAEAGTSDVRELSDFIVEKEIKAIFVESSVPRKNIEALQEAVEAQGFKVEIGGELYSDSTGDGGTPAETYIGTFKENIDTIVDALK